MVPDAAIEKVTDAGHKVDVELEVRPENYPKVGAYHVYNPNVFLSEVKYKLSASATEPAYSAGDASWTNVPVSSMTSINALNKKHIRYTTISVDVAGKRYLHWYAENTNGRSSQGVLEVSGPGAPTVYASIGAKDKAWPNGLVEYTLSLRNAERVQSVELTFEVADKALLGNSFSGLNGFNIFGEVKWTQKGDMWEGKALFTCPGIPGFTSAAKTDIAKLVFTAKDKGNVTLTVTDVKVSGVWEQKMVVFNVFIETGEATTYVGDIYDLNRDDEVNFLDFSIVLYYFGVMKGDELWDKETPDSLLANDGTAILAKYCDFNEDGIIDIVDVSDVFINFTN